LPEVAVHVADLLQDLFIGLGVDWILLILIALSVGSIAVILERWVFYSRRRVTPDHVRMLLKGTSGGVPTDSMELLLAQRAVDFRKEGASREDAENGVDIELRKQRQRYERGLTFLATLGNNAPFIGLLGTVLGIMAAFYSLSQVADAAEKNEMLMRSISEALIATAVGLFVAIPAVLFYNVFRKRVNVATEQAREIVTHRMRCLFGDGNGCDDTGK
jgi:biopolymer transport protein ExbB/TolQ